MSSPDASCSDASYERLDAPEASGGEAPKAMPATFCGRPPSLAPPTCGPWWLRTTLLWCVLVVISGATFFFMLVGLTTIDSVPTRHKVYNASIQILNVLFTYLCVVLLPERALLLRGLVRYGAKAGVDAFGEASDEIFHHLPFGRKLALVVLALVNSLAQIANQATRVVYASWSASNTWPGALWTNVFFALSFLAGAAGGALQPAFEARVRAEDPSRFPRPRGPAMLAEVRDLVLRGKLPGPADGVPRDSAGCVIRESLNIV